MANRRVLVWVGVVAIAAFAVAFYTSVDRPGRTTKLGYYGWSDQYNYIREARALRSGVLPGSEYDYAKMKPKPSYNPKNDGPLYDYAYGLGYPALAAPMVLLGMNSDPFVIPDALLFVADIVIVVILGTRLRSLRFGVLTAAALVFATPFLKFTVVPWSTSITALAVLVAMLVITDPKERPVAHALALGIAVGVCFAARYVDALFPAAIGGFGLLLRAPRRAAVWRTVGGAAAIAIVLALPILWTQQVVFGSPFTTPYRHHTVDYSTASDQSLGAFDPGRAPRSFWEVFLSGEYNGRRTQADPMIEDFPWMVLAPVGLYAIFRTRRRDTQIAYTVASVVSVVASVFYLSFRAGTGRDLVLHSLRYYVAWVPLWALLAAYGIVYLVERYFMHRRAARAVPELDLRSEIPEPVATREAAKEKG